MTQTQKKVKIKAQKLQFQFETMVLFDFDVLCLQRDSEDVVSAESNKKISFNLLLVVVLKF